MAEIVQIKVVGNRSAEGELKRIAGFLPLPSRALNDMAEIWKEAIKRRTLDGKDAAENNFVPYSPSYAKFRSKKGRTVGKVNLFYQGHMMAAMEHSASKDKIRIYFRNAREGLKAHGHTFGSKTLPQREFFALNSNDINAALNYMIRNYGN